MNPFDEHSPERDGRSTPAGDRRGSIAADLARRVDAYLDGELSAAEAAALLRDVARRPGAFSRLSRDQAIIDAIASPTPSPDFTSRILERVGAIQPAAPSRRQGGIRLIRRLSAAAIIVIGVSVSSMMRPAATPIESTPVIPFGQLVEEAPERFSPAASMIQFVNDAVDHVKTLADEEPLVLPAIEYRPGPSESTPFAPLPHRWLSDPLRTTPRQEHLPAEHRFTAIGPMDFV